jgi:hypothetical protein
MMLFFHDLFHVFILKFILRFISLRVKKLMMRLILSRILREILNKYNSCSYGLSSRINSDLKARPNNSLISSLRA